MSVIPFPPRDAGRVLARAMDAAESAAVAAVPRLPAHLWAALCAPPLLDELAARQAALTAAAPIVAELTADRAMQEIVANGMAEEAMIRLRNRGLA